jgi:hypothetical protein
MDVSRCFNLRQCWGSFGASPGRLLVCRELAHLSAERAGGIPGAFARLAGAYGQDVSLAATDIGPERLRHESDMKLSKFRAFQFSCRHLMTHINTYQYISCISHACVYSHGA